MGKKLNFNLAKPAALLSALLMTTLIGCSSPEEKAKAYYEKGMELLEKDPSKAKLEFQNALQIKKTMTEAYYGLALVAEKNGDWQQAFGLLNTTVEQNPKHLQATVKLGQLFLAGGVLDKAVEYSDKALALNPEDVSALTLKAAVLLKLNDPKSAVEKANLVLSKDPKRVEAYIVLATERMNANDIPKTLEILDKGLNISEKNIPLLLMKIKVYETLKQLDKVEETYKKAIAFYPDETSLRKSLTQFYMQNNKIAEAEAQLREMAERQPQSLGPKLDIVKFIVLTKGKDAGRAEMETMSRNHPDDYDLKFALVDLYRQYRDSDAATSLLKKIIGEEENSAHGLKAKGMLATKLLSEGKAEEAKKLIAEVLEADARNEQALVLRAGMAMDERRFDDAINDFRTVLRDNPDSVKTLLLLATAHDLSAQPELAEEQYVKAFQISKMSPEIGVLYARYLLTRRNQPEQAEKVLSDVVSAGKANINILKMLVQRKVDKGDIAGAQAIADSLKTKDVNDADLEQIAGMISAGKKDYDSSIASFKRAYDANPKNGQAMAALVRAYMQAGKTPEAINFLSSVLNTDPQNIDALLLQGQTYILTSDMAKAEEAFSAGIKNYSQNPAFYNQLAITHLRQQKYKEAESVIDAGLKIAPKDYALRLTKAEFYEKTERYDDAIQLYEESLKIRPDSDIIANNLASLLSDRRADKAGRERAYQLAQQLKRSQVPEFLDTAGWASFKIGKYDEAMSLLQEATRKGPDKAIFHYHLGMLYLTKSDKEKAKEYLQQSVRLSKGEAYPWLADARNQLASL